MKKFKFLGLVMACILSVGMIAGCGNAAAGDNGANGEANGNSEEAITFTVGFDAEFPPYGFMDDNGDYTGFDLELAEEVCNRNGWTLIKQPIDWDAKDAELNSGTIDCIWNGFTINGREEQYTFTEPYVDNSQVVIVTDINIKGLADLDGKNVGVQKDSSALAALEGDRADVAETFATLTQYGDYNTAFMDLQQGVLDAVCIDIGVANYLVGQYDGGFYILDEQLSTEQYGVGFKLGNEELRDKVQATLEEMAADGTLDEIAQKYSDYGIPESVCLGK